MRLLFPLVFVVAFPSVVLYKHYVKKQKQDLKTSFKFLLFFLIIWALVIYLIEHI